MRLVAMLRRCRVALGVGENILRPGWRTALRLPAPLRLLLTGARETEVYGLELDDVSFERRTVTFRPNQWRRLKTPGSHHVVRSIRNSKRVFGTISAVRTARPATYSSLPWRWGRESMLTDTRKMLDHVAIRAGFCEAVHNAKGKPVLDHEGEG